MHIPAKRGKTFSYLINLILQSIIIISYLKIMIRQTCLMWKSNLKQKVRTELNGNTVIIRL